MTEAQHEEWDYVQEYVKAAILAVQAHYEAMPDVVKAAAKNRVAMALDSLEDAADYLAAARQRYAQVDDPYANPGPLPPFHKTFDRA